MDECAREESPASSTCLLIRQLGFKGDDIDYVSTKFYGKSRKRVRPIKSIIAVLIKSQGAAWSTVKITIPVGIHFGF